MNNPFVFSIDSINSAENKEFLEKLVVQAKQGQGSAFSEIYNLYFKKIYKFIFYRVSHKEIAEDLTEEVFLKAYTKLPSIAKESSFEGWLYQIARNLVIDHYREKKIVIGLEEIENVLEYESNIIDVLHADDQQKLMLTYLKQLTAEQQLVIKLKFLEDLPNEYIAQALGKTEGAIRVIQHRAISKLQDLINQGPH